MFTWFTKKKSVSSQSLLVDIHSHLLPQIDDGVKTLEEAEEIVSNFNQLGYRKLITTPHVMGDMYQNTSATILEKTDELNRHLKNCKLDLEIIPAAEYYLDESLFSKLAANEKLLTLGNNYLLFETNFITEPFNLKEFIFQATTRGYKPVLAHPERYMYLNQNFSKAEDLLDRGVLFQVNISSITGYYSRSVQQMAYRLIERGWVHWLGSDCHHLQHVYLIKKAQQLKYYHKALNLPLLNNTLL